LEYNKKKKKNNEGKYLLQIAWEDDNTELVHLIIDYSINIGILSKSKDDQYIKNSYILLLILNNNVELLKELVECANKHNTVLNLNMKNHNDGNYPLIYAIYNVSLEMANLMIDYANKHNLILELIEENNEVIYPLLLVSNNNNKYELLKLIIDYAEL